MVTDPTAFVSFKAAPALVVEHLMHHVASSSTLSSCPVVCVFPECYPCIAEARVADTLLSDSRLKNNKVSRFLLMDWNFGLPSGQLQVACQGFGLNPCRKVEKYTCYHELCDAIERLVEEAEGEVKIIAPGLNMSNSCFDERDYTGLERYFTLCHDLHERGIVVHPFLNYIYYTCIDWSVMDASAPALTLLDEREDGSVAVVWQSGWRERWDAIKDRRAAMWRVFSDKAIT